MTKRPRPGALEAHVIYLHGLESSPQGTKGQFLFENYRANAVNLDTSAAIRSRDAADARGEPWSHASPDIEQAFAVPLERARAAITGDTQVIVGSSFGGAVLTHLIAEGSWKGPCLFIASAGIKLVGHVDCPPVAPIIFMHGRQDTIIPIDHSRQIAHASGSNVQLWEIGDDHFMRSITTNAPSGLRWTCCWNRVSVASSTQTNPTTPP